MKPRLSQQYLQECFDYFPSTGEVYWRTRPARHFPNTHRCNNWNSRQAGGIAGWLHKATGYRMVAIGGNIYKLHVLIWVHQRGYWPEADVDHKDLVRTNNRFCNLREATRSDNVANRRKQSNNTSGHKGVSWSKAAQKWMAQIKVRGEYRYLGIYDCIDDAIAVYNSAAFEAFGEFARIL